MNKSIINEKLKELLDKLAKSKGIDKKEVFDFILKEGGEITERNDCILKIREGLSKTPIDMELIRKTLLQSFITGGHASVRAQTNFFLQDKELPDKLQSLVLNKNHKLSEKEINVFIDYAVKAGFHNNNENPCRSNAGIITSIFLAALYPNTFVHYTAKYWKNAAKVFNVDFPSKKSYGAMLLWSGEFGKAIAETPTFIDYSRGCDI